MFDHIDRAGSPTIIIDDATGSATGIPLAPEVSDALKQASLPLVAPTRGANGDAGSATKPGTTVANVTQQNYFVDVGDQGRVADAQGAQQAVRHGVLVARP